MEKPAARVGDPHTCPTHTGGDVMPEGAPKVLFGNKAAARIGDTCACSNSTPDAIIKGAMPVRVFKKPAAREADLTAHNGQITTGCQTVLIGLAGISGDSFAGIRRCKAMAAGRQPTMGNLDANGNQLLSNTARQSYTNCGVESSRQLIQQATGSTITQEQLLNQALSTPVNGAMIASQGAAGPQQMYMSGLTGPAGRALLLTNNGVPATTQAPTMANLETAVSEGRGVITAMDAAQLPNWPANTPAGSWHAITVTGVEYDADGNPINVIVNDTGTGQCGLSMTYAQFQAALRSSSSHVVTNNPIW
jgi:uncharacterized Zn-binding protein involved in type VI secretion